MLLLQATELGHMYGIRELIKEVDLEIHRGDRIGLVGKNGEGKSTLMRILAGVEQPEQGGVHWLSKLAYVPQSMEVHNDQRVTDWLTDRGISIETQVAKELGLRDHIWNLPIASLSGGEQTKMALLAALSQKPELLLLDEPTNHLDMDTVRWLEKWLKSAKIAMLVISHDRHFLNQVTTTTWELKQCKVTVVPGNYQKYAEWAADERERIQHEYDEYLKEKSRLEDAIHQKKLWAAKGERGRKITDSFWHCLKGGDWATAARMHGKAKAMERRLERLEPEETPEQQPVADVKFLNIETSERPVLLRGEDLTFRYGDRTILNAINFEVEKNDRIALVGPNGMGKSTLLHLITGLLTPEQGHLRLTPTATLGYFDQVFESLNLDKTLLDDILELPNMDRTTARLFLGSFLFQKEDVFRPLSSLSYGERVRFVFVKLILARNNMLILDEPSNHLDIATREKIEEALGDYPGAFICASHDRYFLEKMTNKVWEIRDGQITVHPYGFKEYFERLTEPQQASKTPSKKERLKQLKEEILLLETRIAQLSWDLSTITDPAEKQQKDQEFIQLSRQANQLRREINH